MKKLLSIISLASIITFSLFGFMAYLINSDEVNITPPFPPVIVDVYQTKPDSPVIEKKPALPTPPKAPEPLPKFVAEIEATAGNGIGDLIVNVKAPPNDIGAATIKIAPDHDARPIVRISPKYPSAAARNGIEGWVQLAFDINKVGEVVNVSIIDSFPKRTFDRAAKQALRKWKYKAKSENGEYVYQANQTVQLDFNLDQNI